MIGDLFHIKIGKSIDGNKVNKTIGRTAYITRREVNNGLDGFIDYDENYCQTVVPAITIGNETAEPFVQVFPFYTGTKVNILTSKSCVSSAALQFVAQCLRVNNKKYSYSFTINSTRLRRQIVCLPVNQEDVPDWQYMEEYLKQQINHMILVYLSYLHEKSQKVAIKC